MRSIASLDREGGPERRPLPRPPTIRPTRLAHLSRGGERQIKKASWLRPPKWPLKRRRRLQARTWSAREEFAREPFLLDGEKPADLAPGTPRRRALDAALAEIDDGRETPSIEWRGDFSLLLGLERLLDEEPPVLADGAELNAHQVDALSGTLAALIADLEERNGDAQPRNGNGAGAAGSNGGARAADEDDEDAELGEEEEAEEEDDELAPTRSPRTGTRPRRRTSWRARRSSEIPARAAASGSSTRPAPARPSPRSASSRPRAPAAS